MSREEVQADQWETFRIPGMDCPDELKLIRSALAELSGISQLEPDFIRRTLRILYDPKRVSRPQLEVSLRKAGFPPETLTAATSMGLPIVSLEPAAHSTTTWIGIDPTLFLASLLLITGLVVRAISLPQTGVYLLVAATLLAGWPVMVRALRALRWGHVDMHVLMSIAASGALALGDAAEAATAMVLFGIAAWLERLSSSRASRLMDALGGSLPDTATRFVGLRRGHEEANSQTGGSGYVDLARPETISTESARTETVPISQLQRGDLLLVRDHDLIPTDGVVEEGRSAVEESSITGESLPVVKQVGEAVYGGTRVLGGSLRVRVSVGVDDSVVSQLQIMAREARLRRSPTQRFVDRFAAVYTPLVVGLALVIAICGPFAAAWLGSTDSQSWLLWLHRGLVLIVIACPCALVIATPLTIACGLQAGARSGILFKGADYLEVAADITQVAFDKTGTLTSGGLEIDTIVAAVGVSAELILRQAALLEEHSRHPIAAAITRHARMHQKFVGGANTVKHIQVDVGMGVVGEIAGILHAVGNLSFLEAHGIFPGGDLLSTTRQHTAGPVVYVGSSGGPLGAILLSDSPRSDAIQGLNQLRQLGITSLSILTGDQVRTAQSIANRLGISEVQAELLPADKIAAIQQMRTQREGVMMVGDGVNDAPALAAANLGVSFGESASGLAQASADVVILSPNLCKVAWVVQLGRQTRRRLWENIGVALGIKGIALIVAILGWGTMWMAVAADVGASLLVTANGLRMLYSVQPTSVPGDESLDG